MKRAIIVHCWDGDPTYGWYPSTKLRLKKMGFVVDIPFFLDIPIPVLDKRLQLLTKTVGRPDEELVLIGHSLGAITILRYLETLKYPQKIGSAILVAGFAHDLGYRLLDTFFTHPLDFADLRSKSRNFIAINSDNDPYVGLDQAKLFEEKLGAEKIIVSGAGHFTPETRRGGYKEFPELIHSIERLIQPVSA